jgi:hypothetical protein
LFFFLRLKDRYQDVACCFVFASEGRRAQNFTLLISAGGFTGGLAGLTPMRGAITMGGGTAGTNADAGF